MIFKNFDVTTMTNVVLVSSGFRIQDSGFKIRIQDSPKKSNNALISVRFKNTIRRDFLHYNTLQKYSKSCSLHRRVFFRNIGRISISGIPKTAPTPKQARIQGVSGQAKPPLAIALPALKI